MDILHDWGQKMPGNNFFANNRLGQFMSGGIPGAIQRNDWRGPFTTSDQTSIDDIAGMGSQGSRGIRYGSRLAGAIAAMIGGGAYAGAGGASEVGQGFPLSEEAGGAGAAGQL